VVARMGTGAPPANGDAVTLGNNVLDIDVKVRKSSDEGAVDGLERFGTNKNRVRIGKAVRLALLVKHFVDRCFAFLIPDLLEPALENKFVRLRHKCLANVGEKLRAFLPEMYRAAWCKRRPGFHRERSPQIYRLAPDRRR